MEIYLSNIFKASQSKFRGGEVAKVAVALILLFSEVAAHAQSTTYTNGENNTGALSTNGSITLTIASGAATQSGVISGSSGHVSVNSSSSDTGTLTLTATNTYTGSTTVDFGTLAVSGAGASITGTGTTTYVGFFNGDNGALTVSSGGQVSDENGIIGNSTGSSGVATVTGIGSSWTNSSLLYVGDSGTGTLTVSSGGEVSVLGGAGTLNLAQNSGSSGTLNIGNGGAAGTVQAGTVTGGAGTATVNFDETDASYTFAPQLTGSLSVNQIGTGTTILTGNNTYTGGTTISAGTLALSGTGSLYSGGAVVDNGIFDISLTSATSTITIGDLSGSGTVALGSRNLTVGTANSTTFSGTIRNIGLSGGGDAGLDKVGTGTLTLTGTNTYYGYTTVDFGTLAVSGTGASIGSTISVTLVGYNLGDNGALTVSSGGQISDSYGYLGLDNDSSGTATVTGTGSSWNNSSQLLIGDYGTGTLTVSSGGTVTSQSTYLANIGSAQGTVNLNFGGVLATGQVVNGGATGGAFLNLNGGTLESTTNSSNFLSGFTTGEVTLQSGGGTINNNGYTITVGAVIGGTGGLTSTGTGTLTLTGTNTYTGSTTVDFGTLAVSGAGASITGTNSTAVIGLDNGDNGALTISSGGRVSDSLGGIGVNTGSTGNVTVTGTGSSWANGSQLFVGNSGTGTLTVSSGGVVSDQTGYIGNNSGGTGSATVTGTGSSWSNGAVLTVGYQGTGTLTVANGGAVSVAGGTGTLNLAQQAGTTGTLNIGNGGQSGTLQVATVLGGAGTATVNFNETDASYTFAPNLTGSLSVNQTGTGTTILTGTNTYTGGTTVDFGTLAVSGAGASITGTNSNVNVGYNSDDNGALTVSSGGQVSDQFGYIGDGSGSSGTATVTGTDSSWANSSHLYVGNSGTGTLTVSSGGQVSDVSGYIGVNTSSSGTATVTGTGSSWTNSASLFVGSFGTGTLTVSSGGRVSDPYGYIGLELGSNGTATVTGTGSSLTNSSYLFLGVLGTGTLTISSDGTVTSPITELADIGSAQGTVNLNSGGVLATGQVVNGGGTGGAFLNFNGGTLQATASNTDFISNFTGTEVTLQSGGGTIDNNSYNITINSPITGTGSATFIGTGTTTLTATNTYTGGTTINAGTLALSGTNSLYSGGAVVDNATFDISGASATGFTFGDLSGSGTVDLGSHNLTVGTTNSTTFSGTIRDGGLGGGTGASLTKTGAGTLTLTGTNTYSDATTISQGTLSVGSFASVGSAQPLGESGNVIFSGASSSAPGILQYTGSSATLGQTLTVSTGDYGLLDNSGGGVLTLSGGISKNGSVITLAGGKFLVSGAITGSSNNSDIDIGSSLLGSGAATVAITSASNSYNGPTVITDGSTLITATNDALPQSPYSDVTLGSVSDPSGANNTLDLDGTSQTIASITAVSSTNGATVNQVINSDATVNGSNVASGAGPNSNPGSLTVDYTNTGTNDVFSGSLGGSGSANNFSLTKTGAGTLSLTGSNTYTGNTTVDFGTLAVSGAGASITSTNSNVDVGYNSGDNGALTISNGGQVSGFGGVIGLNAGSSGTATVTGTGSTWSNNSFVLYVGYIGTGTLNVEDGGQVNDALGALGYDSGSSGTATVTGIGSAWTNSGELYVGYSGTGTLTVSNGGVVSGQFGGIGLNPGSSGTATVTGTGSSWTNSESFFAVGSAGTGTLTVANGGAVSVAGGTGTLNLAANSGSVGTLNIGNGGLAGTVQAGTVTGGAGTAVVNFGESDASYTFAPNLTGSLNVNQTGAGTTILIGTNTYTGNTTISSGALDIRGSTTNSLITAASGGTLKGSGTVGQVNVSGGGRLAPGNATTVLAATLAGSAGNTLTLASLTVNGAADGGGSILQFNLYNNSSGSSSASNPAGCTVDLLTGTFSGLNFSLTNQVVLDFNGSTVGGNNVYNLVEYGSTTFTSADTDDFLIEGLNLTAGFTDSLMFNSSLNTLQLDVTAAPEPSTWALLLGGLGLLALGRMRKRRMLV